MIMIVGAGVLGRMLAEMLVWGPLPVRVVLAARRLDEVAATANMIRLSGLNQDAAVDIDAQQLDLDDESATAEAIARLAPAVLVNAASVYSYWRVEGPLEGVPKGLWLPFHLSTTYRLMRVLRRSGHEPLVVNGAYPDAVNPALAALGLAPAVGIGNVMNVVPAIRVAASIALNCGVQHVDVRLVAHHYVSNRLPAHGDAGGAPYLLRVYHDGTDVTDRLDVPAVLRLLPTRVRRVRGREGMAVTASSAFAVVRALVSSQPRRVHAPGPCGLAGGYPLSIDRSAVRFDLPPGVSIEEARAVNEGGQVFEGIERIDPDGRTHFVDEAVEGLRARVGAAPASLSPAEAVGWADELRARCEAFSARSRGRDARQ